MRPCRSQSWTRVKKTFLNKMKLPVECEVGIKMSSEDKALERKHRCMLLQVCPHLHGTELVFLDPRLAHQPSQTLLANSSLQMSRNTDHRHWFLSRRSKHILTTPDPPVLIFTIFKVLYIYIYIYEGCLWTFQNNKQWLLQWWWKHRTFITFNQT